MFECFQPILQEEKKANISPAPWHISTALFEQLTDSKVLKIQNSRKWMLRGNYCQEFPTEASATGDVTGKYYCEEARG